MDDQWTTHILDSAHGRDDLLQHEWLLTNGTGAYAMGTAAAVHTRRYHGLLIGATHPPTGRVVALNQMLEHISFSHAPGAAPIDWTSCAFIGADGRDVYAPTGYKLLRQFRKGLSVAWTYEQGSVTFIRELFLHWKQQAVTLRYTVLGLDRPATLTLQPMLTLRDFHSLTSRERADDFSAHVDGDHVTVSCHETQVTMTCQGAAFAAQAQWWNDIFYRTDFERGQDHREDYYLPGAFAVALEAAASGQVITLTAALGDHPVTPCADCTRRREHLAPILADMGPLDEADTGRMLVTAADDFVVSRTVGDDELCTILAGYPWFADWGRDTFIALPGLLLATGRFTEAHSTLRAFAGVIRDGLVPNRFDDYDQQAAHYNTVDASLWFIHAVIEYVNQSGDRDAWQDDLAGAVVRIIDAYVKGTRYDIKMSGDGLISAGSEQTQLTWMDAACNGKAFTPRFGKAVEINALWYHALTATARLISAQDPPTADHYVKLASRVKRAFAKTFWNENGGCLYDHVWTDVSGQQHIDSSFRPNQIFAAALGHSPLPCTKQQRIVRAVGEHLLTPLGLRTLPPQDPNYHGRYIGSPQDRDQAYHQGTVWPWLIGPYAEAVLRAGAFKPQAKKQARAVIEPLLQFMRQLGLGQLHEIYEADPPHRPVGCMAQAWSVAQVLRVLHLLKHGPGHVSD